MGLFLYVVNTQSCKICNQIYYSSKVWWDFFCQSKEIIVVTTELWLSKSEIKLMQVEWTFWNQFWTFTLLFFGFAWLGQNMYQSGLYKSYTSLGICGFFWYFDFLLDHNVPIYSNFFFTISVIVESSEYYSFLLCDLQYLFYQKWHKLKTFREISEKFYSLSPWTCSTTCWSPGFPTTTDIYYNAKAKAEANRLTKL